MKTIRELLEELPEPYRSEAFQNCETASLFNRMEHTKKDALATLFDWDKSPQGNDYWHSLYKSL